MGNFIGNFFNKLSSFILNLIVITLSAISVLGLVLFPTLSVKADATFTEDLSKILFPEKENPTEEDEIVQLVADELVKQQVFLHIEISLTFEDVVICALDDTTQKTRETLYLFTDKIAESVDDKVINKVETAVMKVGVTKIIKTQIKVVSDSLSGKSEEVMLNIGVDEDYVANKTKDILDSIKTDGANVDSVTDAIMNVVDDVDQKLQNSEYKDEIEILNEENRQEIRNAIADIVNSLADENGNIDEGSIISALLSGLVLDGNSSKSSLPNENATYALIKTSPFFEESIPDRKPVDQILKEKLRELITDEVVNVTRLAFLIILVLLAIVAIAWTYLILKILLKINFKNPLIKLKAPITVSWIPFVILIALPNVAFWLFANPPQMLINAISAEGLFALSTFAKALKISFTSSAIVPFVASAVLLVFGVFYSARRKAIEKDLTRK